MRHYIKVTVDIDQYVFLRGLQKSAKITPTTFCNSVVARAIEQAQKSPEFLNAMYPQLSMFTEIKKGRKSKK